jgi:dolichol-phosphate mannosyltransferase
MTDRIACVIVPTYNEADSIGRLIDALCADLFPGIQDWTLRLLIVDGHSPDGTAAAVRDRMGRFASLHLLCEPSKRGIGAAYISGFEHAIRELGAQVVIEFDGDLQHPPESIPLMLAGIDAGYDYILGSRRIPGGGYPAGWSFYRNLMSRGGGWIARVLLFFPTRTYGRITDPTTGLKATRVAGLLDGFEWNRLRSLGFGYKLELLYHLERRGARIREIPLRFGLRVAGESKITSQTPREIFGTALRLRAEDSRTNAALAALLGRLASLFLGSPVKPRSTLYPA